ncbi:MAG: ABC transporter substrate-binding protein [Symploca sp. SIO1C4]|uniref:ABC transporter substrate-binding protein n=1 Tax=Symploca sp. SIO1C4 TaxID=2607765 RepID=A0A6B3N5N4_9CYAN|nr:ABC transporter substrate-binding protein [Symploca sp. SIO1C4]
MFSACSEQKGNPTVNSSLTNVEPASNGFSDYTPVTIENCGMNSTYKKPPERVVTLDQPATEVMLALGLEDRMVGTAYLDNQIPPKYQKAYAKVPVLAKQYPSREVLLATEPDFVYASFPGAFGREDTSERQDLLSLGINSYLSPQGSREICKPGMETMKNVYSEIRNIGRIFGVEERARKLIASLQEKIQETQNKLGKVETPRQVFWYASEDPPYTIIPGSLPNQILELAGGQNVFQEEGEGTYVKVNWEDVIARNPQVIILSDATWSPAQKQKQFFQSNPAYLQIKAVQEEQFVVIDYSYSVSLVSTAEGVRQLAKALYPEGFQ